jgi:mannose-6-phosphate isomerase-like protein (cupin superfamily)
VRHVLPVDFSRFPNGFHSEIMAGPGSGIESCYLICSRVPPGAAGPALHTHPADQFYYVLSGRMNVQLGTDKFVVEPDTLVFIPAGVPHCNWNTGSVAEVHFEAIAPAPPFETIVTPASPREVPRASELIRPLRRDAFKGDKFAVQFLAGRSNGSERAAVNVVEVQPGSGGPSHHIHSFDQFYYVVEGTMNVEIGLKRFQATANTFVVLPAGVVHRNWNEGPGIEKHITMLVPEPPQGERLDVPVDIRRDKAFG